MVTSQALWALRERIAEATLIDGYNFKYDVSLPTEMMYKLVEESRHRLRGICRSVFGYGHVGEEPPECQWIWIC